MLTFNFKIKSVVCKWLQLTGHFQQSHFVAIYHHNLMILKNKKSIRSFFMLYDLFGNLYVFTKFPEIIVSN